MKSLTDLGERIAVAALTGVAGGVFGLAIITVFGLYDSASPALVIAFVAGASAIVGFIVGAAAGDYLAMWVHVLHWPFTDDPAPPGTFKPVSIALTVLVVLAVAIALSLR